MADINDPQAIKFCNEVIRPLAERMRALKLYADDLKSQWLAGMNDMIGSSADDDIIDGREAEGASRLTAADVHGFGTSVVLPIINLIETDDNWDVILKPCVRPLVIGD